MRSDTIKKGHDRAPHRGLLKACGVTDADMHKPFIGIVNSYIDIVPGHIHPHEFAQVVKQAVREAGGVPFEFSTIGVDDGIAMAAAGGDGQGVANLQGTGGNGGVARVGVHAAEGDGAGSGFC